MILISKIKKAVSKMRRKKWYKNTCKVLCCILSVYCLNYIGWIGIRLYVNRYIDHFYATYSDGLNTVEQEAVRNTADQKMMDIISDMTAEEVIDYTNTLLPDHVLSAMDRAGVQVIITDDDQQKYDKNWYYYDTDNQSSGVIGYYDTHNKTIHILRSEVTPETYLHEVGHFVDSYLFYPSQHTIMHDYLCWAEYNGFLFEDYNYYQNASEYFAEAFDYYYLCPETHDYQQLVCPGTTIYLDYLMSHFKPRIWNMYF